MALTTRQKLFVQCAKCGKVNFVRKDFLQRIAHSYRCRHCSPRWRPESFEDRARVSLAHRKYSLDEFFFEKINTEEKAYWLGFLSGDGAITENKVRLCLAVKDKEHLHKFKEAVQWNGKDYYHHHSEALEVYFRSLRMVRDLCRYNVTPRKTFSIKFPSIAYSLGRHFIRGLFDADGCINRAKRLRVGKSGQKYVSYGGEFSIEGSKQLILDLRECFVALGLPVNSVNYSGKKINRIRYGGINQLRKLYDYLYKDATIFLKRKERLFKDILENYCLEIIP